MDPIAAKYLPALHRKKDVAGKRVFQYLHDTSPNGRETFSETKYATLWADYERALWRWSHLVHQESGAKWVEAF
jgi:hypothetical protein